jgi:hypothetical protein
MDEAAWSGENITSGLVGLSYPGLYAFPLIQFQGYLLTRKSHRTSASSNVSDEKHIYNPIFTNM